MNDIKAEYEYRTISDDEKELIVSFKNEDTGLLSLLFNGELDSFFDWIYSNVKYVLENEEEREIAGNICKLNITKHFTYIYNMMSDDDEVLKLETSFLINLLNEWKEKFNNK